MEFNVGHIYHYLVDQQVKSIAYYIHLFGDPDSESQDDVDVGTEKPLKKEGHCVTVALSQTQIHKSVVIHHATYVKRPCLPFNEE